MSSAHMHLLTAFTVDRLDASRLEDAPIESAWMLEGNPSARTRQITLSDDRLTSISEWDCTAGVFRWYFAVDETVHILEGSVIVTSENGESSTLEAGAVAHFPHGAWMTWRVDQYVRKLAFCRQSVPASMTPVVKAINHAFNYYKRKTPPTLSKVA